MKKILSIIICMLMCLSMQAQGNNNNKYDGLLTGSITSCHIVDDIPYMFDEIIKTSLDYTEAIFMPKKVKYDKEGNKLAKPQITGNSFKTFLARFKRDKDWEEKSLMYFCENFNERAEGIAACTDCEKSNYEYIIKVLEVYKNGKIKAHIILKDIKADMEIGYFETVSKDGDDDDEIALRDALKDIGESFGETMNKIIKYKAKQMRKKN